MPRRSWIVAALTTLSLLALTPPASAADGESISQLNVSVTITATGVMRVGESIRYDFGANARHGIIRAIPRWDDLPHNLRRLYDLRVEEVRMDGAAAPFRESDEGAFHMITIGDANVRITGTHTYTITYAISNALTILKAADLADAPGVSPGDVELYWDFIGDGWNVPIQSARATVTAPSAALLLRCYFGAAGSTNSCAHGSSGPVSNFGPVTLGAHEALTGVAALPRSAFTAITAADIIERPAPWGTQFLQGLRFAGPLGLVLLLALVMVARRRRMQVSTVPVTDFVRFEAPSGLRPAEAAVAWRGNFDGRVLTATLLDLASRGAATLTPQSRKRITVSRTGSGPALAGWEESILGAALKGDDSAEVGKYNAKLAKAVQRAGSELKTRARTTGIRNSKAWSARLPWLVLLGVGVIVMGIGALLFVLPIVCAFVGSAGLALVLGGAIGARILPLVQTQTSADFLSSMLGFRRLLDTDAAAARREFAQRSGLAPAAIFATMLPWAVVFGVDEAWAGAFPELTPPELMAYGLGFASANAVHDDIATATRALASAMTNPASGGSGSSGGSSGGGGGGGGGGSW